MSNNSAAEQVAASADRVHVNPNSGGVSSVQWGATSADGRGATSTESGVSRLNSSDLIPTTGGIVSTARNAVTGAPPDHLTDASRVTVDGLEVTLGQAVQMGYVVREGDGQYRDTEANGSDGQRPDTESETVQPEASAVTFAPEVEQAVSNFAAAFPTSVQEAVIAQVIAGGTVDSRAAASGGMTTEQFHSGIAQARQAFESQFDTHVRSRGISDPQHFRQWLHANAATGIKDAQRQHVASRNPNVWNGLVERYMTSNAPSVDALQRGGYETRIDKQHGDMVRIGGMWMTATAAARAKLV